MERKSKSKKSSRPSPTPLSWQIRSFTKNKITGRFIYNALANFLEKQCTELTQAEFVKFLASEKLKNRSKEEKIKVLKLIFKYFTKKKIFEVLYKTGDHFTNIKRASQLHIRLVAFFNQPSKTFISEQELRQLYCNDIDNKKYFPKQLGRYIKKGVLKPIQQKRMNFFKLGVFMDKLKNNYLTKTKRKSNNRGAKLNRRNRSRSNQKKQEQEQEQESTEFQRR